MHVGVLGPLFVRVDERDVTPRGQRLRDLLVVLLQRRGRSVPAQQLLDLVWGERAAEFDVSAVHTIVARLRRQLGPGTIRSDGGGYLIGRDISTDEKTFSELVGRAREQVQRGEPNAACADLRAALSLWRGPDAYQDIRAELVEADRGRLAELRIAASEELAATLLAQPSPDGLAEASTLTAQLISDRPLRERPYQLAMLAAYRSHRQSDALQIYLDLRRLLRAELGIEPTPATANLHAMVLRQDPSLSPLPGHQAPKLGRPSRLPAPVSPLIGREIELAAIQAALAGGRRLISIVGPGGVGKSRLLAEVGAAADHPEAGEQARLLYTDMSGLGEVEPAELAEAIAVGRVVLDSRRPPLESLTAALADEPWLLLIDEAEWVIESLTPVLSSILQYCPRAQIVVTSRIPLDLHDEVLVTVEPLACPTPATGAAAIWSTPAVQFLLQRLADRAVVVGEDQQTAVLLAAITQRLDGLPLALELVAGHAAGRSLADLAALVAAPLDVQASGRTRNTRHRSLRDTLQWSMNRLTDDRRTVLCRLSVFVGRFDLADASVVAAPSTDVDEIVRSLAREALIHVERGSADQLNFRLLRTVRELAAEGLIPEQLAATQARHRLCLAGRRQADSVDLVEEVRGRLDDYVEALRTALANRDTRTLADLTIILSRFWQFVDGQSQGLRWLGRVLDSETLSSTDRASVLVERAALALHHDPDLVLADTAAAIALLDPPTQSPPLTEPATTGETATTVTALTIRGWELYAQGRGDEASMHLNRAVAIARAGAGLKEGKGSFQTISLEAADPKVVNQLAAALATAALIHAVTDQLSAASNAVDEASCHLDAIQATADRISIAASLALALVNLERFEDALTLLDSVRGTTDRSAADMSLPTMFLLSRGWAALGAGDLSLALTSFAASLSDSVPHPADRLSAETLLGAGCALAGLDHPSGAAALAAGLELMTRVQHLIPPALSRAIDRARRQVAGQPWPDLSKVPTQQLLSRFGANLSQVAGTLADGSSLSESGRLAASRLN